MTSKGSFCCIPGSDIPGIAFQTQNWVSHFFFSQLFRSDIVTHITQGFLLFRTASKYLRLTPPEWNLDFLDSLSMMESTAAAEE